MRKIVLLLFILLIYQTISYAQILCQESNIYTDAIINNVLNLSNEQIALKHLDCKAFKKCLTSDQRRKYNMIKKLEKDERKKSHKQKNYYKSNPLMQPFGNPINCPNSNTHNKK